MATDYDLITNVEFTQNYTSPIGGFPIAIGLSYTAFSLNGAIVNVLFGMYGQTVAGTVNAGYFGHINYNAPVALAASTTMMTIGQTSQPAALGSYSSSGVNKLANGNGGPTSSTTEGYGTLELGSVGATTTFANGITFVGVANTLVLDSSSASVALLSTINKFQGAGDQIVFNGVLYASASITGYSNGLLTYVNGGTTYSIKFAGMLGNVTASNFTVGASALIEGGNNSAFTGNLVISYATCFLRGTMIATPAGERPVESLRAGDLVTVIEDGAPVARMLAWTGGRSMRAGDFDDAEAAFPIRIQAGAFSDHVPHRDLLVTPEHCILTPAGLIPARMLVNGASIVIDHDMPDYDFFHLELPEHGILLSEGLTTESYLDTGNRRLFAMGGGHASPPINPNGAAPGGGGGAIPTMAAPLAISRDLVEPIWDRLADRALTLGFPRRQPLPALTSQPDMRLLLDTGAELGACWHDGQRHMFHIPRGTQPVRLLSRAAAPSEMVGPFIDDRRMLGVSVGKLVLWDGLEEQVLQVAGLELDGWYRNESGEIDGARWTDGNAELDLPRAGAETFLDIHLAATMLYRDDAAANAGLNPATLRPVLLAGELLAA